MRKNLLFIVLMAILICFTKCSSETATLESQTDTEMASYENLKSEIIALNAEYAVKNPETRLRPWLRWLIFGAADTAGAIFGGVSGACAASTLAWLVTKDEAQPKQHSVSSAPASAIKPNNLSNLTPGSIGYNHNIVVSAVFINENQIYEKSNDQVYEIILGELYSQTGVSIEETLKNDLMLCVDKIVKCFDANKSIDDFYTELIARTDNSDQKKVLELSCEVIKGLQYVDDDDISYIINVRDAVSRSSVAPELKSMMEDAISVAYASAKLWNTDDLLLN